MVEDGLRQQGAARALTADFVAPAQLLDRSHHGERNEIGRRSIALLKREYWN
jgi:hypothetical protein